MKNAIVARSPRDSDMGIVEQVPKRGRGVVLNQREVSLVPVRHLPVLVGDGVQAMSRRGRSDFHPDWCSAASCLRLEDAVLALVHVREATEQELRQEMVALRRVVVEPAEVVRLDHLPEGGRHRARFQRGDDVVELAHGGNGTGDGGGGIRTHGAPGRAQRFSRPPRSTAPAPRLALIFRPTSCRPVISDGRAGNPHVLRSAPQAAHQRRTVAGAPYSRSGSGTSPWKFSRIASAHRPVAAVPFSVCGVSSAFPRRKRVPSRRAW
jgi:hypothetical protein